MPLPMSMFGLTRQQQNKCEVWKGQTHTAQRLDSNQLCGSFSEQRTASGLAASTNQELHLASTLYEVTTTAGLKWPLVGSLGAHA